MRFHPSASQSVSPTYDCFLPPYQSKQKPVTKEQGERLAKDIKAFKYMECSAMTQVGLKGRRSSSMFDQRFRKMKHVEWLDLCNAVTIPSNMRSGCPCRRLRRGDHRFAGPAGGSGIGREGKRPVQAMLQNHVICTITYVQCRTIRTDGYITILNTRIPEDSVCAWLIRSARNLAVK